MRCYVYKGQRYADYYLYLGCDVEAAALPEALLRLLGNLTLVVEFELSTERYLPQADPEQVLQEIRNQGFYLQMPKTASNPEQQQLLS